VVEQRPFKPLVVGSIPTAPTKHCVITAFRSVFNNKTHLTTIGTRSSLKLPATCEAVNPVGLAAWLAGFLAGYFVHWGIGALNSIVVAGVLYIVLMRILAVLAKQPIKYFSPAR
jgi:hypothetical protein